jgi:hypothetical protein
MPGPGAGRVLRPATDGQLTQGGLTAYVVLVLSLGVRLCQSAKPSLCSSVRPVALSLKHPRILGTYLARLNWPT